MSDYKPGFYAATVDGATRHGLIDSSEDEFSFIHEDGTYEAAHVDEISDVRPLTVLDWHPNPTHVGELLNTLRANYWTSLADQIEAQTKPPRIPEPGLYGVVEASATVGVGKRRWVRMDGGWHTTDGIHTVAWQYLVDPTLIREGVQA